MLIFDFQVLPEVERGIELINRGEYFRAHEVLEHAWRNSSDEVRRLYQGLVQVSVMLYHLERDNVNGAHKLLCKAIENITPFEDFSICLDIPRLLSDLSSLANQLENVVEDRAKMMRSHSFKLHFLNEPNDNR